MYDENTGALSSVSYPKDGQQVSTSYEYDDMFRPEETTSKKNQSETITVLYGYSNDLLTQVTTESSVYSFDYNDLSLREKVKVGSWTLATYKYTNDVYHRLQEVQFGNGDGVKYSYDDLGRVTTEIYYETVNGTETTDRTISYEYSTSGALATMKDSQTRIITKYYYDNIGRSIGTYETDINNNSIHSLKYTYDDLGRISKSTEICGDAGYTTKYKYNANNQVKEIETEISYPKPWMERPQPTYTILQTS